MGISQPIRNYDMRQHCSHPSNPPPEAFVSGNSGHVPLRRLTDLGEGHAQAKWQIKAAREMLRSDTQGPPVQDKSAGHIVHGLLPWQARKVREFIDESLNSKIRLQDCASKARLSSSHFSRAFKATFGTPLCSYIYRRRIERSQHLMLGSKQPLSQIALACGFTDQPHYCRVFRAVVGLSPGAWRRRKMAEVPDE